MTDDYEAESKRAILLHWRNVEKLARVAQRRVVEGQDFERTVEDLAALGTSRSADTNIAWAYVAITTAMEWMLDGGPEEPFSAHLIRYACVVGQVAEDLLEIAACGPDEILKDKKKLSHQLWLLTKGRLSGQRVSFNDVLARSTMPIH